MADRRLFAVYVGGVVEGCHVELHDMRFVAGPTIEACYDDLRAQWWGDPKSLHLDAWAPLDWVDGHAVHLAPASDGADDLRLWFVNLGGYDPAQFTELHANVFVVALDANAARRKALAQVGDWVSPHRDALHEIETVIDVSAAVRPSVVIRLTPDPEPRPFRFEARYVPIGKRP